MLVNIPMVSEILKTIDIQYKIVTIDPTKLNRIRVS